MKRLPIGTQAFEVLRRSGDIYVDKTEDIYNLISNGRIYFLSRPRRFGKSLLISTLKELFKGNKEIFEGLYIWDKWDWGKKYPVIHLDFTELAYGTPGRLKNSLSDFITRTAIEYSIEVISSEIESRFSELIEKMHKSIGEQVVMLIDEYDKPMIDSLNKAKEVHQEIKETLHNFYQVIKGSDEHIRFMFMTGVSRFAGLSIFSALNNLYDITMDGEFSCICGYTQEELESSFKEHIEEAGKNLGLSYEDTIKEIKRWYNGYSWDGEERVYNPFSTLAFFKSKKFEGYWFETGTPTFLIEEIKKREDLKFIIEPQKVQSRLLRGADDKKVNIKTLLFQTGYLTIKKEEIIEGESRYTIDFPNYEVKRAFLEDLLEVYINRDIEEVNGISRGIGKALKEKGDEGLERNLRDLYANIPYDLHIGQEKYYQSLFLLTMKFVGYEVEGEVHTDKGRADVVLRKEEKVIVVEIKYVKEKGSDIESKVKEAMEQIRERKYYEKYMRSNPTLLGIVFNENKEIRCKIERVN
ncbi:MAG: ATP-binding protein [Endomicrobium sp.]|jgi:hypothetical protein|nr:ATP-binding protein [Endomicrobium sp.]